MEKTDNKKEIAALEQKSIPSLIMSYAATTLAALVLNSVYTLTDTLFVSRGVGDYAMGGVSVVFPFVILQSAVATAVGGGAASIVSRRLGEGDYRRAGETTFNAMMTFYISAVIITVIGFIAMEPMLKAMGVTGELYSYAKEYFIIILAGNIFSTGFSSIIRAEGKMNYGLMIWVIPITVNIILDALFIFAFKWGVAGSALATVICQFTSFLMSVIFFRKLSVQNFEKVKLKIKSVGEILAVGTPSLIQMGSLSISTFILNKTLSEIAGADGVTEFAYISKIITFGIVPFTALSQALSPVAGYSFGAGNKKRTGEAVRFCIIISLCYAAMAVAVTELIPERLMGIFTENNDIIASGAQSLRIVGISLLFVSVPMLAGAAFQAVGQKLKALVMYSSFLVFLVPSVLILIRIYGESGIWWGYVSASVAACVPAVICFIVAKNEIIET